MNSWSVTGSDMRASSPCIVRRDLICSITLSPSWHVARKKRRRVVTEPIGPRASCTVWSESQTSLAVVQESVCANCVSESLKQMAFRAVRLPFCQYFCSATVGNFRKTAQLKTKHGRQFMSTAVNGVGMCKPTVEVLQDEVNADPKIKYNDRDK